MAKKYLKIIPEEGKIWDFNWHDNPLRSIRIENDEILTLKIQNLVWEEVTNPTPEERRRLTEMQESWRKDCVQYKSRKAEMITVRACIKMDAPFTYTVGCYGGAIMWAYLHDDKLYFCLCAGDLVCQVDWMEIINDPSIESYSAQPYPPKPQ